MNGFRTVGQPAALAVVERAVHSGSAPHALLLIGPERVGKTTLALDLAAGLLCLADDPAARPCRACAACRKVEHATHPDVHRLTAEGAGGQIRLGQIQALSAELALLPLEGRCRIAVVEGAQRLNLDAQNALLKTLEEPPAAVTLILAADESASLLPTVISRCVRLRLGPVAPDVIAGLLAAEGLADPVQGAMLARLAGGRPGLAFSLARQPESVIVQARLARTLLDLLAADRRRRLAAQAELIDDGALLAAAAGGTEATAAGRRQPAERRAAAAQVLAVWRELARDLALAAHGGRAELRQHELLDELESAGRRVPADRLTDFLARLDAASRALDAYANPELMLDSLLLIWPQSRGAAA
jgi:DNA polymerase-3 subunit delta'